MDLLKHYLERSSEIIGERTPDEEKYDKEVIRWLRKGKPIKKAIAKANQKDPSEALVASCIQRRNIRHRRKRFSNVEDRQKEKSASSVGLVFHHHVENPSGLYFRGRKPAPTKMAEQTFLLFIWSHGQFLQYIFLSDFLFHYFRKDQ
jgi:hypothetical protein